MKSSENKHFIYILIFRYLYLHHKTLFSFYMWVVYPSGVQFPALLEIKKGLILYFTGLAPIKNEEFYSLFDNS